MRISDWSSDVCSSDLTARPSKLYARFGSPTVRELEDVVAELEGAEAALAAASGMASVTAALLGICSSGDPIVATRQLFSVTYGLLAMHLPCLVTDVTHVDGTDAATNAEAVATGPTPVLNPTSVVEGKGGSE